MEAQLSELHINTISLFPLISRLLSVKYQRISHLISFFYLNVLANLKLKSVKIKSITPDYFDDLISHSKYNVDLVGDVHCCALLSVNTLIALSVRNNSWLKITKFSKESNAVKDKQEFSWKIKMPSAHDKNNFNDNSYYIQCLCVSNLPRDFVLYVTNVKLFNISNQWNNSSIYCDLVDKVVVESAENIVPKIAKYAAVAGITSGNDISAKDYEDVLNEHFTKLRCLKVGEVFQVNLMKCGKQLKSRINFCNIQYVYFKVLSIKAEHEDKEYYVLKGFSSLYQSPPIHSYCPQRDKQYINCVNFGFENSLCPTGLFKYYNKLRKIFTPFLLMKKIEARPMFLLCGAKGSGKKTTIQAVAASFGLHLIQVNCFDFYGQNVSIVQGKFDQLFAKVRRTVPCILYLENIEFLGREQNYYESTRLINIFESHVKEIWARKSDSYPLIVIGSTHNNSSEIVSAIDRLFIQTITFEVPSFEETCQILNWLCKNSNIICCPSDISAVAKRVRGFIFADLILLVQYAIRFRSEDNSNNLNRVFEYKDFERGIGVMEAAYSDSIGAARVPTVKWEDVGGLEDLKDEIMVTLNLPLKHPELFTSGLKRSGIIFYGPPGTGKTLMAKAVATECNYNFLAVKGPELMNMYVGQSEKNVRDVFERARDAAPCIIFFDELDSLAPSRGKSGDSGGVTDRVVSQLLAEMDGLDKNKNVFVIAATNRPDLVDPALLRPGRFDKMFYVGVCSDGASKLSVFKALTRKFVLQDGIDFEKIIESLPDLLTGADIYSVCSNAWFSAARRAINSIEEGVQVSLPLQICSDDFSEAVKQFVPSLTRDDIKYYEALRSS